MVYCTQCGFKNEGDAKVCAKCGASLKVSGSGRRRRSDNECFGSHERDWEDECFGLPHAGAIAGVVFGVLIVLFGVAMFLGTSIWQYLWPFIIMVFGLLIVAGAIYRLGRRH